MHEFQKRCVDLLQSGNICATGATWECLEISGWCGGVSVVRKVACKKHTLIDFESCPLSKMCKTYAQGHFCISYIILIAQLVPSATST